MGYYQDCLILLDFNGNGDLDRKDEPWNLTAPLHSSTPGAFELKVPKRLLHKQSADDPPPKLRLIHKGAKDLPSDLREEAGVRLDGRGDCVDTSNWARPRVPLAARLSVSTAHGESTWGVTESVIGVSPLSSVPKI